MYFGSEKVLGPPYPQEEVVFKGVLNGDGNAIMLCLLCKTCCIAEEFYLCSWDTSVIK